MYCVYSKTKQNRQSKPFKKKLYLNLLMINPCGLTKLPSLVNNWNQLVFTKCVD